MSAQVFTLEQVCKEQNGWQSPLDPALGQDVPAGVSPGELKHQLHEVLRHLVITLALPLPLDEMLHSLATMTTQAMGVDLCVILLKEDARDTLRVYTCAPDLSDKGVEMQPVTVQPALWQQMYNAVLHGQLPRLNFYEQKALNPLQNVNYETLLPVPLVAGNECIGLINCYSSKVFSYSSDDELMLSTIANQAALAIKHRQCVEEDVLVQKSLIRAFVSELCEGGPNGEEALRRRAYFLGYDLARPHVVALIELLELKEPGGHDGTASVEERFMFYEGIINQVKRTIQERYRGSLIDVQSNRLVCLFSLADDQTIDQLGAWLDDLVPRMRDERHIRMFVGTGNLCCNISDYQRGYAEANEALEVGRYLHQEGCSSHFSALGAYRYIYKFACTDTLRDQYQEQIATIVEYDRRKKTNLLDTLEIYLECGGNVAKTSSHLDVHRNTLLQRLDRLQKLCALDLERLPNRLPLLVALKVHKLRTHNGYSE